MNAPVTRLPSQSSTRDEDKSTLFLSASLAALVLDWLTKTWAEQAPNGGMWPAIASSAILCGLVIWLIHELLIGSVPWMIASPIGLILGVDLPIWLTGCWMAGSWTFWMWPGCGSLADLMADICIVLGVTILMLMALIAQRSGETKQTPSVPSHGLSQERSDG